MRCLLTFALLVLAVWPAAAQENEAEKLFRSMEQKVRSAKTLQFRFDGTVTAITPAGPKKSNVKGTMMLADGDKLRVEGEGNSPEEESKMTVVSDGIDMKSFVYVQAPGQPKREMNSTEKSPKGVGQYYRSALPRHGLFVSFLNVDQRSDFAADSFELSDFKLAGKEKIGEQNTQVIQYTITAKEKGKDKAPTALSMKVWLDAKTNLPVKTVTGGRSGITEVTETNSEFIIDAKVNVKLFELPKSPAPKDLKNEGKGDAEERLVGTWQFNKIRANGEDLPIHLFDDEKLGFTPIMLFARDGKGMNDLAVGPLGMGFKYKLSGQGKIDVISDPDDKTQPGIYKFDGDDKLTLCISTWPGADRPTEFAAEEGNRNRQVLYVLVRGQPLTAEQSAKRKEGIAKMLVSAARTQSTNNLKMIGIAMQGYAAENKSLPMHAIYGKDGKTPLLSWRVAILPYVEQADLYKEFKLDEPWDSEHNKKLIPRMPAIYDRPTFLEKAGKEGKTFYQVFTGPGTVFPGNQRMTLAAITDGTSNTVLAIEARNPVIWTRPEDLTLPRDKDKMPAVGGPFKNGVNVLFCDGSVRFFRSGPPAAALRALVTPNGGEVVDVDKLLERAKDPVKSGGNDPPEKPPAPKTSPDTAVADDAEKRIRAMEKTLATAKTLQVSLDAKVEGLPDFGIFKGTLIVAENNKIHLDGAFWNEKERDDWKIVSDGGRMKYQGLGINVVKPASKKLTENYRSSLTHGGYLMVSFYLSSEEPREAWPIFRASELKFERKEKIGRREAYVIVCNLTPLEKDENDKGRTWTETLWLDAETNLPLKRIVVDTLEAKKATFTESYTTFSLDPKIDAKLFELPK